MIPITITTYALAMLSKVDYDQFLELLHYNSVEYGLFDIDRDYRTVKLEPSLEAAIAMDPVDVNLTYDNGFPQGVEVYTKYLPSDIVQKLLIINEGLVTDGWMTILRQQVIVPFDMYSITSILFTLHKLKDTKYADMATTMAKNYFSQIDHQTLMDIVKRMTVTATYSNLNAPMIERYSELMELTPEQINDLNSILVQSKLGLD